MKEGSIYHWSERIFAHCCPGTGSPAISFSGCVQPFIIVAETVLQKRNLDSFREVPTVSYVALGPQFGDDSRFFDKIAASMRKWWFAPVCIDHHWWLYAFEIAQKRLWGRIIEDMAKVSMPAYEHTENDLPRFYLSVPQ
ncbi:hypothetical protein AHAS_Ahas08G0084800 [Arachis hypogaea]